ncbi:MAG: cyclic lactone autoinducer peptide [Lachnospiraceae bacterium]|jgi:cyclic lactone autoinducer peptide|nr:cyclic lactone autoinducer peptide [Lachnospiraceae bacterium]
MKILRKAKRFWSQTLLSVLAAVAGVAAAIAVNSACSLVLYEPEMPKELE